MSEPVVARAPGRVNLIGDHTDTTFGRCLPIAIDRFVEVAFTPDPSLDVIRLSSAQEDVDAVVPVAGAFDAASLEPEWARYVGGVVQQIRPPAGGHATVKSTVPAGVGLSSSAALEVACALAFGAAPDDPVALARSCQAAEHAARGVPTGMLDQLASICGVEGQAVLLDCFDLSTRATPLPPGDELAIVVLPGAPRSLASSGYADRLADLHRCEAVIGPLRTAELDVLDALDDPVLRRRAKHVITENQRVLDMADALAAGDLDRAGALLRASHASLRDDYESSHPDIDALCRALDATAGVFGSRIVGGGWGGAVLAFARPGTLDEQATGGWTVRAARGAHLR